MSAATPPAKNGSPDAQPEPEAEEEEVESGPGLGRNVVWGLAAGGSSMVVHLALLLVMGLMISGDPPPEPPKLIEASVEPERDQEEITQKLEQKITPSQTLNPASSVASAASAAVGVSGAVSASVAPPKLNTTVSERPTAMRVDVGAMNSFTVSGAQFVSAVPEGTLGDGLATAQGYGDAMDRITQEILNMLAKRKVMLVWVMDQSESMQDDREEITTRIERVYEELGLSSVAAGNALLTGVISYGERMNNHMQKGPTSDTKEIMGAIRSIQNDPSGMEMQSDSVIFAVNNYGSIAAAQNRQMAMVLVTDESGDMTTNGTKLEQAIQMAKAANCKVYVLGREAIFGYPYAQMSWVHEASKTTHWLRIDRGPETPQPEQLQINGFHRRHDAFPSGFGPYEQSRIARQTGGIFFMLPSPEVRLVGRDTRAYDADAMRPYLPDLSPRDDYVAERQKNPLRAMVWQVISDLNPWQPGSKGSRCEVRLSHFSIDRAVFANEAAVEMKKAEDLIRYLAEAQKGLESVAGHRAREKSPRWRANYDLIYAQVVSYQARLQEYGWYMAEFTKNPKPVKNIFGNARPTNGWWVHGVQRLLKPDVTQAQRDKADTLFREIQKEYAGTPWGERAGDELKRGYGIELNEGHENNRGVPGLVLPKF